MLFHNRCLQQRNFKKNEKYDMHITHTETQKIMPENFSLNLHNQPAKQNTRLRIIRSLPSALKTMPCGLIKNQKFEYYRPVPLNTLSTSFALIIPQPSVVNLS